MEKHLLLGNGINIQFGGSEFTSAHIIKRIKNNSAANKYDSLFADKISGTDIISIFEGLVGVANSIIEGKHNDKSFDLDTTEAICDFMKRYTKKVSALHEIMLEDWLLLLHVFFSLNNDLMPIYQTAVQGFEQLLLDAIYNNGEIQKLYLKMNDEIKNFFLGYENIFTLNYDNNIESLTNRKVYHLHGDFSVLADSENPETALGYIRTENGDTAWIAEMKHCYCNALLNYSGRLKYKTAMKKYLTILDSETYHNRYKNDILFRTSLEINNSIEAQMIRTKIMHPELKMATDYYFSKFESIKGELGIIGLSPNNDQHIFDGILNNKDLTKVVFYYHDGKERDYIESHYPNELFDCLSVQELWKSLKCGKE